MAGPTEVLRAPLRGHWCLGEETNHLQACLGFDLHPSPPGSIHTLLECLREPALSKGRPSGTLGVTSTYKPDRTEMQVGVLSLREQISTGKCAALRQPPSSEISPGLPLSPWGIHR